MGKAEPIFTARKSIRIWKMKNYYVDVLPLNHYLLMYLTINFIYFLCRSAESSFLLAPLGSLDRTI